MLLSFKKQTLQKLQFKGHKDNIKQTEKQHAQKKKKYIYIFTVLKLLNSIVTKDKCCFKQFIH